jgi:hypothetical protein
VGQRRGGGGLEERWRVLLVGGLRFGRSSYYGRQTGKRERRKMKMKKRSGSKRWKGTIKRTTTAVTIPFHESQFFGSLMRSIHPYSILLSLSLLVYV